jgi:polyisoprenoid-binding protein YceI
MVKFALLLLSITLAAHAADLDPAASKISVHVEKSGLFSGFAHNHTIAAPLATGHIDAAKRIIELKFRSADMTVLDPEASASERSQIESTMKSEKVLDPARFPEITFVSTSVEPSDPTHFQVRGNLTLHGATRPIEIPVSLSNGHYTGKVPLKQTEYGITPVKIAGGAVKVKDVIEIEFEIGPPR